MTDIHNLYARDIYNWSAVRSGAVMRVLGEDKDGNPVKITGVSEIRVEPGIASFVVAIRIGAPTYFLKMPKASEAQP